MSEYACKQPVIAGLRHEVSWQDSNGLDVFFRQSKEIFNKLYNQLTRKNNRMVKAILTRSAQLEKINAAERQQVLKDIRQNLRVEGINTVTIIEAFAVIQEVSGRELSMRHHHTQLLTSLALLRGGIAEMSTGEGKTLAATLAAATAGLAGIPVHLVTVNDYLAERDAHEMLPLYRALGLSVGIITHEKELAHNNAVQPTRKLAADC